MPEQINQVKEGRKGKITCTTSDMVCGKEAGWACVWPSGMHALRSTIGRAQARNKHPHMRELRRQNARTQQAFLTRVATLKGGHLHTHPLFHTPTNPRNCDRLFFLRVFFAVAFRSVTTV